MRVIPSRVGAALIVAPWLFGFADEELNAWLPHLADEVHAQFDRVLEALWDKLPAAAEHLESAREEMLAFTAFPKEIRRCTYVVGVFPNRQSLIRLVGAVLAEQHEECSEGRRYMNLEALTAAQEIGTEPDSDTDPKEVNRTDPAALTA